MKKQCESVFSKPKNNSKVVNPDNFFFNKLYLEPSITDIDIYPADFVTAINEMPLHCAPGPDSWNSVFIKQCKESLPYPFYILRRKSLDTKNIPDGQLLTDIAILHKGSSKSLPKNY